MQNRQLLFHSGADIIFDLPVQGSDYLKAYALACLCQTYQPGILLFPATVEYSAIAARTAAQLGTGLTADCIGLTADEQGLLLQTRPAFGGGLIADIICRSKRPQMATVHSGVFPVPVPDPKRTGQHIAYTPPLLPHDPSQLLSRQLIPNRKNMRDGQIIVAGGKGVGSREGFELLAALAQRIGGLLGASRSAVDVVRALSFHSLARMYIWHSASRVPHSMWPV